MIAPRSLSGIAILAWIAGSLVVPATALAGEERLNLFQLVARASFVVHVKVREGALKFAVVDVLETIKGAPPANRLRISFRQFNWNRPPGVEPIVFPDGQEEILFLVPPREIQRKKNADVCELLLGPEGRMMLPAEGSGIILEAIRRLAALAARSDPSAQIDEMLPLLGSNNPYLVETALDEIARLRAAQAPLYPSLVDLLKSPSASLRRKALRLIAQIFAGGAGTQSDQTPEEAHTALAAVLERARNDTDEQVRVDAVAALSAWPSRQEVEGDLKAIAGGDPAQAVRYEAEKALFVRSRS